MGIRVIVESHAAWGVPNVWATRRGEHDRVLVSRQRVYVLMKEHGLTLALDAPPVVNAWRG